MDGLKHFKYRNEQLTDFRLHQNALYFYS